MIIAVRGDRTRLPIAVAIALAASLRPLEKPKPRAAITIITRRKRELSMLEDHALKDIRYIFGLVNGVFQMLVDLTPLDDIGNLKVIE